MHRPDADRTPGRPRSFPWGAALLALAWAPVAAHAQDPAAQEDPWKVAPEAIEFARNAPLFRSAEPLELTLTAPFETIKKEDRGDDAQDRPATLALRTDDGRDVTLELKLATRGNWRRDRHNCDFPPLWLDLDKDQPELEGTVFQGQNRLKLYVTCKPGKGDYEQYILQEYLVYPTYNLMTDESFRARLARVHYEDTDKPEDSFTSWAFVLEHKDQMAARNEAVPLEAPQVHPALFQPEKAALEAIFNYMIGMTDWSSVFRHNVEVIRRMDGEIVPVSYDFDWSGIVNTSYARPDPKLDIRNVRERIYQGFCQEGVDYDALFQRFLDHRDQIIAIWSDFDLVEPDRRKKAVDFLDEFFDRISDSSRRERIVRNCTPIPR